MTVRMPHTPTSQSISTQRTPGTTRRSSVHSNNNAITGAPGLTKDTVDNPDSIPSNCLWVGNVSPDVTQYEFKQLFSQYGPIVLIRHFTTSKCAFVTYQYTADAIKALKALDGYELNNMSLTLNLGRASKSLWLGNVSPSVTSSDLIELFSQYGMIDSIRVLRHNQCAFINFQYESDAYNACNQLNGTVLNDNVLVINYQWHGINKKMKPTNNSSSDSNSNSGINTVSDKNLSVSDEEQKESPVSKNEYPAHLLPPAPITPIQRTAIKHINNPTTQQKDVYSPSRQLFVGNLSPDITDEFLYNIFSQYGTIESIRLFATKQYAFITYTAQHVAEWVKTQMQLYRPIIYGREITVKYGKEPHTVHSNCNCVIYNVPNHITYDTNTSYMYNQYNDSLTYSDAMLLHNTTVSPLTTSNDSNSGSALLTYPYTYSNTSFDYATTTDTSPAVPQFSVPASPLPSTMFDPSLFEHDDVGAYSSSPALPSSILNKSIHNTSLLSSPALSPDYTRGISMFTINRKSPNKSPRKSRNNTAMYYNRNNNSGLENIVQSTAIAAQ